MREAFSQLDRRQVVAAGLMFVTAIGMWAAGLALLASAIPSIGAPL